MLHVQPELFRKTMAAFPAGVTIITSSDGSGSPVGATVSAFLSLSATPPLVLVSLFANSRTALAIRKSGAFVAHFVGARHSDLAMRFASSSEDKFAGLGHSINALGAPVLHGFDVSIECRLHAEYPGGDHAIFVGLVEAINDAEGGTPAVWYDRKFCNLDAVGDTRSARNGV